MLARMEVVNYAVFKCKLYETSYRIRLGLHAQKQINSVTLGLEKMNYEHRARSRSKYILL